MPLSISAELKLPDELVTEPLAIVARRGRGKTYTGAVLAEEFLEHGQQIVAIDPMDVWWGLRMSDNHRPGYPVVIFGGDHADVKLDPSMGADIADFLVSDSVPAIIVPEFDEHKQTVQFMTAFLNRLLQKNRDPLHVFFDEAEAFAPERPAKYEAVMLGAMGRLIKRGRVRGVGATLITQRTASLNKNVLTQVGGIFALALSAPWDRAPIEAWMKTNGTAEQMLEVEANLAGLPIGDGYFWHPDWDIFKRIHVRTRTTFDSSATPKPGQRRMIPKSWPEIDIQGLNDRLQAALEQAHEDDPEILHKQIRELKNELRIAQSKTVEAEPQVVEVPVIDEATAERMYEMIGDVSHAVTGPLREFEERMAEVVDEAITPLMDAHDRWETAKLAGKLGERKLPRAGPSPAPGSGPRVAPPPATRVVEEPTEIRRQLDGVKFGKGERTVLEVLSEYPAGRTHSELAFLAGYSAKASTIDVILSNLRKAGFVEQGQPIRATAAGLETVGGVRERPVGEALLNQWLNHPRMGKGERAVLEALIDYFPDAPTLDELCARTGYSPIASTMAVILSNLRKLGLVEKGHRRVPSEFMEAIGR